MDCDSSHFWQSIDTHAESESSKKIETYFHSPRNWYLIRKMFSYSNIATGTGDERVMFSVLWSFENYKHLQTYAHIFTQLVR